MGPLSYMRSVVDQNIIMRRIPIMLRNSRMPQSFIHSVCISMLPTFKRVE